MNKKNTVSRLLKISIFIILVGVTFYVVFKNNNFSDFVINLKGSNYTFIALAILCMFMFLGCEALNIKRVLKSLGEKLTFLNAFKYSLVGFFFSSITPSSTGGQPAQIYFMKKDGISISHSTLTLLIELSGFQLATGLLAFLGFILNYDTLVHHLGNIKFLVFLGIAINLIIISALIVVIFSKKLALKLVDVLVNILEKFHYKNTEKLRISVQSQIDDYHECSLYLKKNKSILIKCIITNIVQMISYHAIPFCIYLAFGLSGANALTVILMQAVLYIAVASLPFPGAVGISEGTFMIMFKIFFPENLLGSAMIISRGISFYLFVLISAIGVGISMMSKKKGDNRKPPTPKENLNLI